MASIHATRSRVEYQSRNFSNQRVPVRIRRVCKRTPSRCNHHNTRPSVIMTRTFRGTHPLRILLNKVQSSSHS